MKQNIKPKSKIGKDKFKREIKSLNKNPEAEINKILFYKHPGEKSKQILKDRFDYFRVIDLKQFENIFSTVKSKKDLRDRSSLFYFQRFDSRKGNFTSSLPKISSFIDFLFKYPTTKHRYEIIAVTNPKNKVIGYTTIKVNKAYMERITEIIDEMKKKGKHLIEIRNKLNRIVKNKLSNKYKDAKNNLPPEIKFHKLLLSLGFEIYFTPETGYKLDNNFNFVPDKK